MYCVQVVRSSVSVADRTSRPLGRGRVRESSLQVVHKHARLRGECPWISSGSSHLHVLCLVVEGAGESNSAAAVQLTESVCDEMSVGVWCGVVRCSSSQSTFGPSGGWLSFLRGRGRVWARNERQGR